jgi:hypothetical protein
MKVSFGSAIAVVLLAACSLPAQAQNRGAQVFPGGTFHPYNGTGALFSGGTGINYGNGQFNPMIYSNFNPINYGNGQFNPMIYSNFNPIDYGNGQANRSIYSGFNPINYGNGQANRSIYSNFNPINYGNDQFIPRNFAGNAASNQGIGQNQVSGTGTATPGAFNNSIVPQNSAGRYLSSCAQRYRRYAATAGNAGAGSNTPSGSVSGAAGALNQTQSFTGAARTSRSQAYRKSASRATRNTSSR